MSRCKCKWHKIFIFFYYKWNIFLIKHNYLIFFFIEGPKSDTKTTEHHSPYFEDITTKMEERRCDLLGRHKYLKDKITTMERSIPALMAYNMWMSKKCENAPYCKIREIMKKFAPYPDQTEKLLENLKNTVKNLNKETDELHVRNDWNSAINSAGKS